MEDQGINSDNATALATIKSSIRAAGNVAEKAIRTVEAELGQSIETSKWRLDSDEVFFARFGWQNESWLPLEFTFRPDEGLPDSTGALVFMAGITHGMGRNPFEDAQVENTLSDEFKAFMSPEQKGRIMRILPPEALLEASSQEDQARILSDWILASFEQVKGCFG